MKYRKKPVVIDAVQWTGGNHREMFDFLTSETFINETMTVDGNHFYIDHGRVEGGLIIKTLEGEHIATIGDYIIKGVKGEYYPCKEDVFLQTYEKVDEIQRPKYPFGDILTIPCGTKPIEDHLGRLPDEVPYGTICSCNPSNGGSGICGCVMGNKMVPNPKKQGTGNINYTTNTTGTYSWDDISQTD
jgi:hypothetical protein